MSDAAGSDRPEADPSEVEPTDNSTGAVVDLERVEEIERETKGDR
jgi:hypothetical protein